MTILEHVPSTVVWTTGSGSCSTSAACMATVGTGAIAGTRDINFTFASGSEGKRTPFGFQCQVPAVTFAASGRYSRYGPFPRGSLCLT
jgi:hypothetical protein